MSIGQHQECFLAVLLAALGMGILLGHELAVPMGFGIALLIVALAAGIALLRRQSEYTWLAFAVLFFALGLVRFAAAWQLPASDISHWAREQVVVTGTLTEAPRIRKDPQGKWKIRYTLEAASVKNGDTQQRASGRLYVYAGGELAKKEAAHLRIGDEVQARGKVLSPHNYQDPGQMDSVMLLRCDGITASLAAGKAGVKAVPQDTAHFSRWLTGVRTHYRERMEEVMPASDAAMIFAMLFGGYEGVPQELVDAFTTTGIVHILSVSGSHISLLAAVIAWIGLRLHLPQRVTAVLVILVIAIYSMLAGCVPPVIRSAIMGGLTFIALALGREKDARRILLLTGLVMLMLSPLLLFHISFQLSFAATAGLLYVAPVCGDGLMRCHIPGMLAAGLAITIAAQLVTLPFLAWYFHQVSVSALLANLLAVPILELIIVIALFGGILAAVLPFLGKLIFLFASLLGGFAYEIVRILAKLPGGQVWLPTIGLGGGVLYYAGMGLAVLPGEKRQELWQAVIPYRWHIGAALLCGIVFCFAGWVRQPNEMRACFVDVHQGDCCAVLTPHGHAILFDTGGVRGGNFDIGTKVDVPYLWYCGIRHVDAIFLTHCHEDHAAGTGGILHQMPVDAVYTAGEGVSAYARSMGLGDNDPNLAKFHVAYQGQTFHIDGVTIEVLFAPPVPAGAGASTGNEASNVYRITYGNASFLITGDLVKEQEEKLLEEGIDPRADVLKVGHHGSDTSTSEAFLQAVHPKWAMISVGADNTFGHPKPDIVKRLKEAGAGIYRTDEDGATVFRTDGKKMKVETFVQ